MARPTRLTRRNLGYLLAKASQRWNELLLTRFRAAGFAEIRPAFGSVLIPLYEEDGLRMGELARRAGLSKQAMTGLVRAAEEAGLVRRRPDQEDGRASRVSLTKRSLEFRPVAEAALAELDELVAARLGEAGPGRLARELTKGVIEL